MIPVLSPAEMAAADAASPVAVEVLIERAGGAVARQAVRLLGGVYGRRVVIVAGKGNNGADGRAAAAKLRRRGVQVAVIPAFDAPALLPGSDLVIDAAYGTGFHGTYDAPEVGEEPVLAIDIPSGVSGLTGEACGRVMQATCTVTFTAAKPGLLLEPGASLAGEVVIADIGIDIGPAAANLVEGPDVAGWLPGRGRDAHKWDAALLVIAGSPGMTGAANLVASAAQRAGAGMVRVGVPGVVDDPRRPTEAVGVDLAQHDWASIADRCGALVVGPGLGRDGGVAAAVRALLATVDLPAVVDADALVVLGTDAARLHERRADTVLTPHDGEYEHLMGHRPGPDRLDATRQLAATTGSVAVLKGSTTVIADPTGRVRLVTTGDARLATAGTGDVLSGVIGALLARGAPAFDAASAGAWLHGRAARLGSRHGLVAGDLPMLLPRAMAEVRP